MAYTVKVVAEVAGISIRALHHYDHIGLLKPAAVSPAAYRLYTDADLERLQQILFFRELGFGLQEIKTIVDSPSFDKREALVAHKQLLLEKQKRLDRLIRSVERTIEAMDGGVRMDERSMFEGFDESKIEEYRKEARARWGDEAVDESDRRTARYTKEDWAAILAEMAEIERALASLMDRAPADSEVQRWIDRHFRQIDERFCTCTPEVYRGLGDLYVADSRFTAHYDQTRPGLAAFMRAAMQAYCDRLTAGG